MVESLKSDGLTLSIPAHLTHGLFLRRHNPPPPRAIWPIDPPHMAHGSPFWCVTKTMKAGCHFWGMQYALGETG